jgi:hypothetical protein
MVFVREWDTRIFEEPARRQLRLQSARAHIEQRLFAGSNNRSSKGRWRDQGYLFCDRILGDDSIALIE